MAKYRKKPVVIEAIQWDGNNIYQVIKFSDASDVFGFNDREECTISTLEGVMTANAGDWILKGIKGEFYPCKNDIFEATYEAV